MTHAATPARAPAAATPAQASHANSRGGAVFDQTFFALLVDAGDESVDTLAALAAGVSPLPAEEPPTPERAPLAAVPTAEAFPPAELVAPLMAQILASTAAPSAPLASPATSALAPPAASTVAPPASPTIASPASPALAPPASPALAPPASLTIDPPASLTIDPLASSTIDPLASSTVEPQASSAIAPPASSTIAPPASPALVPPVMTPVVTPESSPDAGMGHSLPEAFDKPVADPRIFDARPFPGSPRATERAQAAPFGLGAESAWPRSDGTWAVEVRGLDKASGGAPRSDPALPLRAEAPAAGDRPFAPAEAPVAPAVALGPAETAAPRTAPAHPSLEPIAFAPSSPAWKEAFAERVTLVTRSGVEEAEIVIRPAELGPVEVRVRIQDGEALLSFDAPHPETREAIELALPRLREMLAESGLAMRDAHVGSGDAGRGEERTSAGREGSRPGAEPEEAPAEPVRRRAVATPGRVDTFV